MLDRVRAFVYNLPAIYQFIQINRHIFAYNGQIRP